MGSTTGAWDVARPLRPCRVAGVDMAGFRVPGPLAGELRVVPHPAVMLILEFGAGAPTLDDGTGRLHQGSLVAGPGFGSGGGVRARGGQAECVQVRLSPVVAGTLLGVGPAELTGGAVSLDDLWGREAARTRERLNELPSWQDRFALMDELLARRCAARPPVDDPAVAWAWQRIVSSGGLVRVDHLAAELGWSRKRLWSRFLATVGMPPKSAAKLVRFDRAVHRMVGGQGAAQVAADSGYFDQSHLNRDVMEFTGSTPSTVTGEPFLTVDDRAWPTGGASVRPRPATVSASAAPPYPTSSSRREGPGRPRGRP